MFDLALGDREGRCSPGAFWCALPVIVALLSFFAPAAFAAQVPPSYIATDDFVLHQAGFRRSGNPPPVAGGGGGGGGCEGAVYPSAVVTNSLQAVYDQAPGRCNAKGNRITTGLKKPTTNASQLPGGAGTVSGDTINVPAGTTSYSGWDMSGFKMVWGCGTSNTTIIDSSFKATGGTPNVFFSVSCGTVTASISHVTIDGTSRSASFAGGFYHTGGRLDLTLTDSYYVADIVDHFIKAGSATGNWIITDNYLGPTDQNGSPGDHSEIFHDFSDAGTGFTFTFSRNFADARSRTGASNTCTGYLFSENSSGNLSWLVEDNIFAGSGDTNGLTWNCTWAFQMGGSGSMLMNRNLIQQETTAFPNSYMTHVGSFAVSGTNNRKWGIDGNNGALVVQGGLN